MKKTVTLYAKIIGKAIFKGALISIPGIFISIVFFLVALYQGISIFGEVYGGGGGGMGHSGLLAAWIFMSTFAIKNTAGFILLVSAPWAITFYLALTNKTMILTVLNEIWRKKAQDFIMPKIQTYSENIVQKTDQFDWIKDAAVLKVKLLEQTRNDPETNGLKKRVINYLFKKTKLNEVNYEIDKSEVPHQITTKISDYISEVSAPSWFWFRIIFFLQIILFIISLFL